MLSERDRLVLQEPTRRFKQVLGAATIPVEVRLGYGEALHLSVIAGTESAAH